MCNILIFHGKTLPPPVVFCEKFMVNRACQQRKAGSARARPLARPERSRDQARGRTVRSVRSGQPVRSVVYPPSGRSGCAPVCPHICSPPGYDRLDGWTRWPADMNGLSGQPGHTRTDAGGGGDGAKSTGTDQAIMRDQSIDNRPPPTS